MAEQFNPKRDDEEMGRTNEEDMTGSTADDEFEDIEDIDEDEDDLES